MYFPQFMSNDHWQLGRKGYLRLVSAFPFMLAAGFAKSDLLNLYTLALSAASGWALCHLIILIHPLTAEWQRLGYERRRMALIHQAASSSRASTKRHNLMLGLMRLADQNHLVVAPQATFESLRSIAKVWFCITTLLGRQLKDEVLRASSIRA